MANLRIQHHNEIFLSIAYFTIWNSKYEAKLLKSLGYFSRDETKESRWKITFG